MPDRRQPNPALPFLLCAALLLAAAGPHAQETKAKPAADPIEQYQKQLQSIEDSGGAMDPRLQKILLDMGHLYRERGDNANAAAAFKRALFIDRSHNGLQNPGQIPIVEDLIDADTALSDAKALDRNYQYLYFLYRRNYGDSDRRTIDVIQRIARWRLHAYQLDPHGTGLDHLVKADILYGKAEHALRKSRQENGTQRLQVLYHKAVVDFYLAKAAEDFDVSFHTLRAALIDNGRPSDSVAEQQARKDLQENAELEGELAINQVLDITRARSKADPVAYAHALMFAGDWYLCLYRHWDAMRHYHKAWKVLAAAGMSPAQIALAFGKPRPIDPLTVPGDKPQKMPDHKYVDAVVDVNASGWPTDIRVRDVHPSDDNKLRERGRRAIAAVRFRPHFEHDEPVATSDVPIHYVFR